jgi:TatD DNase family protein
MNIIDTHAHLYVDQFKDDIDDVILRAKDIGVSKILLPNIDVESINDLLNLWQSDTKLFYPMMGIHPSSIAGNYEKTLESIFDLFDKHQFVAVGEIGLDYYWSKEFIEEQKNAFIQQIRFAISKNLPIAVHCRDAFDDILDILENEQNGKLKGVLHCFTGNTHQAQRLVDIGFKMGIGGVITFKNSGLNKVVEHFDVSNFILETDSPYLAPAPYRGKRNETAYIQYIVEKLSETLSLSKQELINATWHNALEIFDIEM